MLAENINAALQRGRAIDAARRAERDHFGTVAQLSAALAALKTLAPDRPMNNQKVRDVIDQHGQRAGSFTEASQVRKYSVAATGLPNIYPEFDTKPRKSLIYIGGPLRIATTGGSIERFGLVFSNSMRPAHWPVGR